MAECGGLQLTPPKAQRVNERRVLEIKAKEGIEDSLVDADFRTLCRTACSKASYDKQHRDEGLESRHAAELREKKNKVPHVSLNFSRMKWNWEELIEKA